MNNVVAGYEEIVGSSNNDLGEKRLLLLWRIWLLVLTFR
ncbi:MAG: hypothetical protein PG980_000482 [Wolbachia endosymbiont of Ctenocephalides felis wCfeJ]|nr:MAG: hypothetical protein PG980_000482 [Wolbachia endosymbiont of Ctenocephalides felis wCfeJ]